MTLTGFALVLSAAFCHATWNFLVKRINGGTELIWLFSLVAALLYLPLVLWIMLIQQPEITALGWAFMGGSALLHLGYLMLLQTGYRKGDLSLVYPTARATGPVLSTTFAVLVLGEVVTLQMAVGAAIIIGGVLMLTGGIKGGARHVKTSLLFGLATGMMIGGYTAWDAYAVSVLLVPVLLLDYATTLGRVVLLAPVAMQRRALVAEQWRGHRLEICIIAVFLPLAYILVLYALTFTPVAYVAPLREVSVLLTVLAGTFLLGEGDKRQRLTWAAVILSGMAILATA